MTSRNVVYVSPFVRLQNGRFVLSWKFDEGWQERPLTFRERVMWRVAARTPQP